MKIEKLERISRVLDTYVDDMLNAGHYTDGLIEISREFKEYINNTKKITNEVKSLRGEKECTKTI